MSKTLVSRWRVTACTLLGGLALLLGAAPAMAGAKCSWFTSVNGNIQRLNNTALSFYQPITGCEFEITNNNNPLVIVDGNRTSWNQMAPSNYPNKGVNCTFYAPGSGPASGAIAVCGTFVSVGSGTNTPVKPTSSGKCNYPLFYMSKTLTCDKCPIGTGYNGGNGTCTSLCPGDRYWNPMTSACAASPCLAGTTLNVDSWTCPANNVSAACPAGTVISNGTCTSVGYWPTCAPNTYAVYPIGWYYIAYPAGQGPYGCILPEPAIRGACRTGYMLSNVAPTTGMCVVDPRIKTTDAGQSIAWGANGYVNGGICPTGYTYTQRQGAVFYCAAPTYTPTCPIYYKWVNNPATTKCTYAR
jgi:hypothetical protein